MGAARSLTRMLCQTNFSVGIARHSFQAPHTTDRYCMTSGQHADKHEQPGEGNHATSPRCETRVCMEIKDSSYFPNTKESYVQRQRRFSEEIEPAVRVPPNQRLLSEMGSTVRCSSDLLKCPVSTSRELQHRARSGMLVAPAPFHTAQTLL